MKSNIFDRNPSQLRIGHCLESSKHRGLGYDPECSDCVTYTHFMITEDTDRQTSYMQYFVGDEQSSLVQTPSIELVGLERGVKLPIEALPSID